MIKRDNSIDLLFTDLKMPRGMDGRALAVAARQVRPELKVLFTTGYSESLSAKADEILSAPVLMKPNRKPELAQALRDVLDADRSS